MCGARHFVENHFVEYDVSSNTTFVKNNHAWRIFPGVFHLWTRLLITCYKNTSVIVTGAGVVLPLRF